MSKECPRCGRDKLIPGASAYRSAPLEASSLRAEGHDTGVDLDRCAFCGGVFLDPGELSKIQSVAPSRTPEQWRADAHVAAVHARQRSSSPPPIPCPRCQTEMAQQEWFPNSGVEVDMCRSCGSAWLDGGELVELLVHLADWRGAPGFRP